MFLRLARVRSVWWTDLCGPDVGRWDCSGPADGASRFL